MLLWQRTIFSSTQYISGRMSALGTFQLTHPELLSETQLRDILKNSCIDFSKYEKLSNSELLEMYKRVAMPLPQRQGEGVQDTDEGIDSEEGNLVNDTERNSNSLNNNTHNLKRNFNDTERMSESCNARRSKSPVNEQKQPPKKIRLINSKGGTECNGLDKRTHDERQDESPFKKRQKITWP